MSQNLCARAVLAHLPRKGTALRMHIVVLLIGLCAGILVGLLGIGGGVVLVPALVHLSHMDQHMAQGTSLFVLLPPIGLGALLEYRKKGAVDFHAGIYCAVGMLLGDRKSTRLNSSHSQISYAVFCLKKKKTFYVAPYRRSYPLLCVPSCC